MKKWILFLFSCLLLFGCKETKEPLEDLQGSINTYPDSFKSESDDFLYELNENPFSKMFVWEDNDEIVGYMGLWIIFEQAQLTNLAVNKKYQGKGYAKALIEFLVKQYRGQYSVLQVGTGDSPLTIPFYEKCGFVRSHSIPNFFTDNYDHPIIECGVQLVDMIYLRKSI